MNAAADTRETQAHTQRLLALTLWGETQCGHDAAPVRAIEAIAAVISTRARMAAQDLQARMRFAPTGPATPGSSASMQAAGSHPQGGRPKAAQGARCAVWAMPRSRHARWPELVGAVCRAPGQFTCWQSGTMRHDALLALNPSDPALAICSRVAQRALGQGLSDPTGGATHYHAADTLPPWAVGELPVAEVGGFVFYRLP